MGMVQVGPLLISDVHENVVGVDEVNLSVILLVVLIIISMRLNSLEHQNDSRSSPMYCLKINMPRPKKRK